MSLEAKIEALTEQVTQLTDAVTVLKNVFRNAATVTALQAVDEIVERIAEPVKEEVPNDSPKPSTTTDTSPPSSNESRTVTYDDVKNVTIAVSKIDKAKAVAGLARFGVATAKALEEKQWLEYVEYMERVAKGEVDPESSHE